MSHTSEIDLQLKDKKTLIKVLNKLNISYSEGVHKLFSTTEKGLGINLPGWKYPAVIKDDGSVAFDNYNGKWGKIEELNKVKAHYTAEIAKKEMKKKGYKCIEKEINGKIQIRFIK